MIRCLCYAVLALLALLLQTSFLPALLPSFVKPELLLLLTVYLCLVENFLRGGLLAWSFGCLLDCLGGHYLGLQALVYLLLFLAGRWAVRSLNSESPLLLLFMAAAASLAQPLLLWIFGSFADIGRAWPLFLERTVFQAAINTLSAFLLLHLLIWLQNHYEPWLTIPGFGHLRKEHGS